MTDSTWILARAPRRCLALGGVVGTLLACGGTASREDDCFDTRTRSGFCDYSADADAGAASPPSFGNQPPPPPPPALCAPFTSSRSSRDACPAPLVDPTSRVGEACTASTDCPSACCVIDPSTQRFHPYEGGPSDAGADATAEDGAVDAGPTPLGPEVFRTDACFCGVCRSLADVCSTLDPPPLGG